MDKKIHTMKLRNEPFASIASGEKTIELRLYDEKRQQIKAGDIIEFVNIDDGAKIKAEVLKLYVFNSFETLYQALPLLKCGYTEETVQTAKHSDMEDYYSLDEQSKYSVVGIELKLI